MIHPVACQYFSLNDEKKINIEFFKVNDKTFYDNFDKKFKMAISKFIYTKEELMELIEKFIGE